MITELHFSAQEGKLYLDLTDTYHTKWKRVFSVTPVDTTAHITLYPVHKQSVTGQVVSNEPDPQKHQH